MIPWTHQTYAEQQTEAAIRQGIRRIAVTSPTGSGKGTMLEKTIENAQSATLYTDRRALMDQTAKRLQASGFQFGIRAAGHEPNLLAPIQLCMIQTEESRVIQLGKREHNRCERVIIDEAHRTGGGGMLELIDRHLQDGSTIIGYTATPVGMDAHYDHLIVAARNSDCFKCGALVPAQTFAPDEPDLKDIKLKTDGEFEVGKLAKFYKRPIVFGRIADNWQRLNPERMSTILFAPDVSGSRWFCEQLNGAGIPAGHIEAKRIIIGDEVLPNDTENRQRLHDALNSGEIKIVCNRFVLREGIDWPWVRCAIFATAFGGITAYLQSGGRVLRSAPGKEYALVIDHGGNFHRHGSLNEDRVWRLDQTDYQITRDRENKMRNKNAPDTIAEPTVCPKCSKVRLTPGIQCPSCGFASKGRSRMVIQADGTLKEVRGDIYRPRRQARTDDEWLKQDWVNVYHRCKNAKKPKTFSQALGLFAYEHRGMFPNAGWPYMPVFASDEALPVKAVPVERLTGYPDRAQSFVKPSEPDLFGKGAA